MPPSIATDRRPVAAARSRRPPPAFAVQTTMATDAIALVAPAGELDLFTVPHLRDALDRLPESVVVVIVDVRGLMYCDTSGVHAISEADEDARLRGKRLVMVPAPDRVHAVFELTGVGDHLEMVTDPRQITDEA